MMSKDGRRARNFRNAINMAAVSQHGEVSGHADSHMMAVDSGLLIAFLCSDSAFYVICRCPQTIMLRNATSGINSR
ncbi:unnamed protein product, partial [Brenthis ino]